MATWDNFLDCKEACDDLMEVCKSVKNKKHKEIFIEVASRFQSILALIEDRYWKAEDFGTLTDEIKNLQGHVAKVIELEKQYEKDNH